MSKWKGSVKLIWYFVKPYKISFFMLFFCVSVISFINMLYPYFLGIMVNEIFYYKNINFFKTVAAMYVILFIGERLIHLIQANIWTYLSNRFLFDIRKAMFDRIIMSKANALSDQKTGDLIMIINDDTSMFMDLIHMNIFNGFNTIVRFIFSFVIILFISSPLAVLMFVVLPFAVYLSSFIAKKVKKKNEMYRQKNGLFISWAYEMLGGVREIRLMASERNAISLFNKKLAELIRLKIGISITELVSERAISLISLISDICLYIISSILILQGNLTIGGFITVIDYFGKANNSLKNLNEANVRIRSNMVSIERVLNVLSMEIEADRKNLHEIHVVRGKIEFSNITFSYNNHNKVLKNLNLHINAGEKIAIVSQSGSGKSTLIGLLTGLYSPDEGLIKIDDVDISTCSTRSLRRSIGVIRQDNVFFDGSIKYNLMLADPKCRTEDIWRACEQVGIADYIRGLPNGLDTIMGRGGQNLSGGQKQRLAMARMILKNPRILVFDDATSAMDFQSEKETLKLWTEQFKGRTMIIIAQRLSTIINTDRVAVLNDGGIVSSGHHINLLDECEHYRELFLEQYVLFEDTENEISFNTEVGLSDCDQTFYQRI